MADRWLPCGAAIPQQPKPPRRLLSNPAVPAQLLAYAPIGRQPGNVFISASSGGVTKTAGLLAQPAAASLANIALNPTSVIGGNNSTGTVTFPDPAPAGGSVVLLSSGNSSVAGVPVSVAVASGNSSATFVVSTTTVSSTTAITISASYGGVAKSAVLSVAPPALSSVSLSPTTVVGGSNSTGTARLSGPAPSGGVIVALSSSNSSVASVPVNVTIPAGSTSATFSITTRRVYWTTYVTISGIYGGVTRTARLTVRP